MILFNSVYNNKRVLITGHTGFKGSWLSVWLNSLGAKVYGLALDPNCYPSMYSECDFRSHLAGDYRADITCKGDVLKIINEVQPEFVFHLAAQALVKKSYSDPVRTMEINSIGTANVLHAVGCMATPVTVVLITSDKCYENVEFLWGYKETDRLGGSDPYSASKAMAEIAINCFVKSYLPDQKHLRLGVGRAGNVIGGGDWSADRIIPDCVKAWSRGETVNIRSPKATRPWQHVLEPLSGYLHLGSVLFKSESLNGEAFNY
ncbi:CDP-glucose 4,6-dehydratase [bacterium]|nr:CDP-glucose 4,6-dehydratase [bacterium]